VLAGLEQLAGEQPAEPVGVLDGPDPLRPTLGPPEQPGDLPDISVETELVEHRVVFVEGDRGVRPLVGFDPDHDRHEGSFHQ
jgi:hypothetical protein